VATLHHEGSPAFDFDGNVSVYRIQGALQQLPWLFKNPGRPWAPPFPDPAATAALKVIVVREQPDLVHGHDWLARAFLPLKRRGGPPLAMSLHYYTIACAKKNMMHQEAPCTGPGFAKCLECSSKHYGPAKGVPVALTNWATAAAEGRLVDMYLPVSHATAEGNSLPTRGLPFRVIHNFVRDSSAAPTSAIDAYVSQLPSEPFMLFVGDLRRYKGLDVILRAYAELRNPPPLVLIGKVWPETPDPSELPPGVTMFKHWPNEAVMQAWRRCTLGLAPSVWPEPCATVVLEAMSVGRPVIATSIGGTPEMVAAGETGLLVAPGDQAGLRDAMQRLCDDGPLRERMGAAAAERAKLFQVSAIVPQFEQVYQELVDR
jgi:glycosyltransferase involved in cell wall biosynthesis